MSTQYQRDDSLSSLRSRVNKAQRELVELRTTMHHLQVEISKKQEASDSDESWVVYSDNRTHATGDHSYCVPAFTQICEAWDAVHEIWKENEWLEYRLAMMDDDNWWWDYDNNCWWYWNTTCDSWSMWDDGCYWDDNT